MTTPNETPRTDACPHCGAAKKYSATSDHYGVEAEYFCDTLVYDDGTLGRSSYCEEREKSKKLEAEVERLRDKLHDCLSFLALHGAIGATPDTAKLLEKRILATLNQDKK